MRFDQASGKLCVLALMLAAGPMVMAQDSGWYLGANVGKSTAKIDDQKIIDGLIGSGFTVPSITDDKTDTGYKIFAGYQFGRFFALEGGYFDLGKFGFTANTLPAGTLDGTLKLNGFNLDAVFSLPFTQRFSAFARIGANYANVKDTFTGTGSVIVTNPDPSQRALNYKFGAGLEYDFTHSFGMRAELERYRIKDAVQNNSDIDLASIGVLFKFGRHAPAPVQQAVEPVTITPAPEPVVVAAPVAVIAPPEKTETYCTALDLTFEIDQAHTERDDKEGFRVLATYMQKYPDTTAVIEGYTDNVGTDEHNLQLSKERAENVVTYLVDVNHIDRARLRAVGYGSARPIADNATEEGKRANRRVDAVIPCVKDFEGLVVTPARITMLMEIEFDSKSSEVLPQHRDDLRKVANFLKANPAVTATVEGHTANLPGGPEAQMEMSKQRAEHVVTYLVDNFGIERSRLSAEGFGRTREDAYNATKDGRQENRRVNIIINYPKKP